MTAQKIKNLNLEKLFPISELIETARAFGIDFGKGNAYERIRYFIKLGLIPRAEKLFRTGSDGKKLLEGHFPGWIIYRLLQIQELNRQGVTVLDIQKAVGNGKLKLVDLKTAQKNHQNTQSSSSVTPAKAGVQLSDRLHGSRNKYGMTQVTIGDKSFWSTTFFKITYPVLVSTFVTLTLFMAFKGLVAGFGIEKLPNFFSLLNDVPATSYQQPVTSNLADEKQSNNSIVNQLIESGVLAEATLSRFLEINTPTIINNLLVGTSAYFGSSNEIGISLKNNGDLSASGNTTLSGTLDVIGQTTLSDSLVFTNSEPKINFTDGSSFIFGDGTNTLITIKDSGNTADLTITGALTSNGDLTGKGALAITGASTLSGAVTASSSLKVSGATTLSGSLEVSGASTLSSTLKVSSATTLSSTLAVTGASTFAGAASITDTTQSTSTTTGSLIVSGGAGIAKNVYIGGDLVVTGAITGSSGSSGATTFTGQILASDGTVAAPGYSFSADTDTGLYRSGSNTLDIATGGVQTGSFSTTAINIGTDANAKTINIGTGAVANTIAIGSSSTTGLSLTDNNWNITVGGVANFVSVGATTAGSGAFTTLTSSGNTTLGTASSGTHTYSTGAGSTTTLGNSTGALTVASGGTSAWTNTSGNLTISTATSGTLALTSAGVLTITAAAASTWSTSNGLLTITGDDGITLNASSTAGITGNVPDNIANAVDFQQGSDNYINVNTTNSSENVAFGNATTNPSFSFLGTGAVTIAGSADGTDALILTAGDLTITNGDFDLSGGDFNVTLDAGDGVNISKGAAPSVDVFTINGGTSATSGVDTLQLTQTISNTSGNVLDVTPTFTTNANATFNIFDLDAFTATADDSAGTTVTGTVRAVNIGNITESLGAADVVTSSAVRVGTGWDDILNYNGTTIVNGTGQVVSTQITGTIFSNSSDSNSGTNTIIQGDTLTINGGTNGIDTSLSNDTYTLNFDSTEVGTTTWGSGSAIVWTFDAGSVDPAIDFNSGGVVFNETGADVDFRIEGDNNANLFTLDAGLFSGVGQLSIGSAAQSTATAFMVIDNPAITATSNQNFYKLLIDNSAAVTVTGATTSSIVASLAIDEPNITATGTVTDAVTLYLSGAPTEGGTGNYAFLTAAGNIRHNLAASDKFLIDAATTDNTGTAGALDIDLDTTASQAGIDVDLETITDAGVDTVSGIKITATATSTDADVIYGLHLTNLAGTATAGNEYAIYQAGTAWDYGALFEDDVRIGATDYITLENDGDMLFVDADGAATITGPAGGALSVVAGAAQALTLTGANSSTWSTSNGLLTITGDDGLTLNASSTAGITGNFPDNITNGLDLQEGSNNYINVNTTNSSENVAFGNTTTNPSFSFLGTGAVTIAGSAEGTASLTQTAGDHVITDGDLTISGGEIAATSDDATGTNFSFTTGALSTGTGLGATSSSNSYTTGKILDVSLTQSAATGTSVSGDITSIAFSPTYSTAITTPAISGNVADISRSSTTNSSFASTLTVSGAVVSIADTSTQTTGTLTHTGNVLFVDQNYSSSSGNVLSIENAGTGSGIALASSSTGVLATLDSTGAVTTADGILIRATHASGIITDGIDVSDDEIVNGINVGSNTILGAATAIDFTEFDVSASTGAITINDGGDAGNVSIEGTILDINSLDFVGAGSITSVGVLTIDPTTGIAFTLTDNQADALDIQEGTSNYININTTNSSENVAFGNATTNPSFSFLGTGAVTIAGSAEATNALVLTAGAITLTDGDLTLSGGEISATTDDTTTTGFAFVANTITSGNALTLSGTGMTTGEILDLTGTWAPTDGSDNEAIDINLTHTPTTSADTFRGLDLNVTEGVNALANTLYSLKVTADNSANTSTGTHTIYGGHFTATGKTAGTTTAVGLYATAASADNNYAAIFESGNVGIGTTAPSTPLHVNAADGGATVNLFTYGLGGAGSASNIVSRFATLGGAANNRFHAWDVNYNEVAGAKDVSTIGDVAIYMAPGTDDAANGLQFATGLTTDTAPTVRLHISQSGNVGIGTTTPVQLLDVVGGQVRIDNNGATSTTAGCFRFNVTQLEYSNDNCATWNSFAAAAAGGWTDDGAVVRLTTSTDSVGIGTTSPASKFTVLGTAAAPANSGTTATGYARFVSDGNEAMDFGSINTGSFPAWIQVHDSTNQATNYPLALQPNGGNVGIGTTSPGGTLDLRTTSTVTSGTFSELMSYPTANPGGASTAVYVGIDSQSVTASANAQNLTTTYGLRGADIRGSHAGSGTVTGAVGVLAVANKTSTGPLTNAYGLYSIVQNTNATNAITNAYGLYIDDSTETGTITNDYGVYQVDTGAINYFGGNVGIGTTAPTFKLDVEYDTSATNVPAAVGVLTLTSSGTVANGFGPRLVFDAETATANTLDQLASIAGVWEDATAGSVDGALVFETRINSGNFTERMRINASGNVGIGTTTPNANLTINQGTATTQIVGFKGSDIAHGITTLTETDTFGYISKGAGASGALGIFGITEATYGLYLQGISTTASTTKSTAAQAAVMISALNKSGTTTANLGANENILAIQSGAGDVTQFIFDVEGTGHANDVWSDNAFDLAEDYPVVPGENLEEGDVVRIEKPEGYIKKSDTAYDDRTFGVISYHTAQLSGYADKDSEGHLIGHKPVALIGRVPVKVSLENGPIKTGDFLTSSSTPGVAMKATKFSTVLGKALEDYDGTVKISTGVNNIKKTRTDKDNEDPGAGIGKILGFINVTQADPNNFLANLSLDSDGNLIVPKLKGQTILIDAGINLNSSDLKNYLTYQTTTSGSNTSYSIDVAKSLEQISDKLVALDLSDQDQTNESAVLSEQIASSSAVIASVAKQSDDNKSALDSLKDNIASQSSTIDNIRHSVLDTESTSSGILKQVQDDIASLKLTPPQTLFATGSATLDSLTVASEATFSGKLASYDLSVSNIFKSLGQAILGNTTVAGNITQDGTLSITDGNSINVIGLNTSEVENCSYTSEVGCSGTLFLQNNPLAQALDILDGLFIFDQSGKLTVTGEVLANQFSVKSGESVGIGTILAGQTALIIENEYVNDDSIILLTAHNPLGQSLAVTEKTTGGFAVELNTPELTDLTFDYLVVGVK